MAYRDIVVIGASAGGVEALIQLVRKLPPGFPAAVFVVLHISPGATSQLPQILSRKGHLPAAHPADGDPILPGRIYIAPPNRHLLLEKEAVRLSSGPKENGFRPAVDPLFHSAARSFGPRTIAVILSGTLGDGGMGARVIKATGGLVLVQDPDEAIFADMPLNTLRRVTVDQVASIKEIVARLIQLVTQDIEAQGGVSMAEDAQKDAKSVQTGMENFESGEGSARATSLTCPECGGTVWEIAEGEFISYRCHVGHAFSSESLLVEQSETLESALWTAVRTLEERASLLRRMAVRARQLGNQFSEKSFIEESQEAEQNADVIRQVLVNGKNPEAEASAYTTAADSS